MSYSEEDIKWYVIRCFSGHEKKVKENLLQLIEEAGIQDKVQQILIPTETVIEIKSGKKKTKEKNFFPGYILFKGVYDDSVNSVISNAQSVIGFLKADKNEKNPTPLRQDEVDRILGKVSHDKEVVASGGLVEIPFKKGDLVKVVEGPFRDFDGNIEEVYPEKLKLIVLVSIFGRKTPVEVDVNQVEPQS
jgi:transcriptional antiterminator NusG